MHELLGFSRLIKLHDTRLRIVVVLCSSAFVLADLTYDRFKYIIEAIRIGNTMITLDEQIIDDRELSKFTE